MEPGTSDELILFLEEIDESGQGLSQWEINFVSDLLDKEETEFTPNQERCIRKLHNEKVC